MQSERIEELAQTAVFEINQSIRQPADREWTEFVMTLPFDYYPHIMENHSQHVLLAFMLTLKKYHDKHQQMPLILTSTSDIFANWYRPNGQLVRTNGQTILKHIQSLCGALLGHCLKSMFKSKSNQKWIIEWLGSYRLTPKYKLFICLNFIECIQLVDSCITFIAYRTLSTSFQDTIIPILIDSLIPFFLSVHDAMQVGELAELQQSMRVDQSDQFQNPVRLQLSQMTPFTQVVFKVLESLVSYHYNINFKQYDGDDYDNCVITFPDPLIRKIIDRQFLDALYAVIHRLMKLGEHRYLITCLNCLGKIILAKTTYLTTTQRQKFIIKNVEGVCSLFQLLLQNQTGNKLTSVQIVGCNLRLVNALSMREVQQACTKSPQGREMYQFWIRLIKDIPIALLQAEKNDFNIQNQLILTSIQLFRDFTVEMRIHRMTNYYQPFRKQCEEYTTKFFNFFILRPILITDQTNQNLQELKTNSKIFIQHFKTITTANYLKTFSQLLQIANHLFNSCNTHIQIANLLHFLRQILSSSTYFQQGLFGDDLLFIRTSSIQQQIPDSQQLQLFGQVLNQVFQYINLYTSTQRQHSYLNDSIVLFMQVFINKCINQLSGDESKKQTPKIRYKLYYFMKKNNPSFEDQAFLLFCLQVLTTYPYCKYFMHSDYLFQVLYQHILKLKLSMPRQYFKGTLIYSQLVLLFHNISKVNLTQRQLKWRVLLYQSIAALCFDDVLDSYRFNIREAVSLIRNNFQHKLYSQILYDLIGISKSVQNDVVFYYFLHCFTAQVNFDNFLSTMFSHLANNRELLTAMVHLCYNLINNKARRFEPYRNRKILNQMLGSILPYISICLQQYGKLPQNQDLAQEFQLIFLAIVKQKHINVCQLDMFFPSVWRKYVKLMIKHLADAFEYIEQYPVFAPKFIQTVETMVRQILGPLLNCQDLQIGQLVTYMLQKIMHNLWNSQQQKGKEQPSNWIEGQLKIIQIILDYIHQFVKYQHRLHMLQNFKTLVTATQTKLKFIATVLKIGFDLGKQNRTILTTVSNITLNMFRYFQIHLPQLVDDLGLKQQKDVKQITRIYESIIDKNQEEWIALQIKDWIRSEYRYIQITDQNTLFDDY